MKKLGPSAVLEVKGPIDTNQHDVAGLREVEKVQELAATKWRTGTNDLLAEKNVELLDKIRSLESRVESMLLIPNKPKDLKKRWLELLNEYERALNQAIAYASRHLDMDRPAAP